MAADGTNYCKDCGLTSWHHAETWLDAFTSFLSSTKFLGWLPASAEAYLGLLLEKFFLWCGIASFRDDFTPADIPLKSACFIEETRKKGLHCRALRGPFGYTNHFVMELPTGKRLRFDGLPTAEPSGRGGASRVDDKQYVKETLQKENFPVAPGKSFWIWEKKKAVRYGVEKVGFPLVVKPRWGSVARHVTTRIADAASLGLAIRHSCVYSPAFVVERFLSDCFVHRATVIDFDFVACVKQVPAHVTGNGKGAIDELINEKNSDPRRSGQNRKDALLRRIRIDEVTADLLRESGYSLQTVPAKGEIVYLQKDPFLRLGGDLEEVTPEAHPDNLRLFRDVAKLFDVRLVGIDFITGDLRKSWRAQPSAILELNSLPCIEMHQFPSAGESQNVAAALLDTALRYPS